MVTLLRHNCRVPSSVHQILRIILVQTSSNDFFCIYPSSMIMHYGDSNHPPLSVSYFDSGWRRQGSAAAPGPTEINQSARGKGSKQNPPKTSENKDDFCVFPDLASALKR